MRNIVHNFVYYLCHITCFVHYLGLLPYIKCWAYVYSHMTTNSEMRCFFGVILFILKV